MSKCIYFHYVLFCQSVTEVNILCIYFYIFIHIIIKRILNRALSLQGASGGGGGSVGGGGNVYFVFFVKTV